MCSAYNITTLTHSTVWEFHRCFVFSSISSLMWSFTKWTHLKP
jgi:hypothetical protein